MKIGKKTIIYDGFEIRSPSNIEIGENTIIGFNAVLDGRKGLYIGDNVNFSSDVMVYTLQHDYNSPDFSTVGGSVFIKDYAWVSVRAVVLPGVTIGKGAVVAGGSIVTEDVEEYTLVGGVPARPIGKRTTQLHYSLPGHGIHFV